VRKKENQGVAPATNTKPFFARYLEGQQGSEAATSAKVGGRNNLAHKRVVKPPIQTLKFPSDGDELHYYPYYPKKPSGGGFVTLKFPSDSDEHKYVASYAAKADVPKGKAKPKAGARIYLKKK
jgi:hypothetical protein